MTPGMPAHPLRRLLPGLAILLAMTFMTSPLFADDLRSLIQTRTLENGLEVIVIPDDSVPIVTVELTVKNGAFTETEELNGLSHLYEHMFFKGNAVIPNQEAYLKRMRELGIVFNGTTSSERVNYFFTLPAPNLREGLVFLYDATVSPNFDAEEFEKEKEVVLGEADRAESSPHYWLRKGVAEKLWHEYPARKDPLGSREAIKAATIEQMKWMKDTYYVPNNSTVLVAGDVDAEGAFALVEEIFKDWERGEDPFAKYPVPEHPPLTKNEYVVVKRDIQTPALQVMWHGPKVNEDPAATHAADVLSYILGQQTSEFYKSLVDSGITLGAGTGYFTQRYTGPSYVSAAMQPEKVREAIRAIFLEVDRLKDPNYYTDEQLESAKTILSVQEIYSREETSSFAHTVTFWWAVAGLEYYYDYNKDLQAVTREDIARYVETYVIDKPFVAGLLLSEEHAEELGMSEEELEKIVEEVLAEISAQASAQ
ncbi:MAG: M16 family metallopeptidase [Bradymonadaceae bacterium]